MTRTTPELTLPLQTSTPHQCPSILVYSKPYGYKMKDSNHKSRNHSKNDKYEKRHNGREESTDKYHNVLKERHYRDDLEYDRNGKNHNSNSAKHHSDSNKEKRRSSEHKSRHNHPKSVISSGKKEDKKHKRSAHRIKEVDDESYEELSRKKRRIESELHALDLEEAAAKEAESKKAQRQSSDVNKRKSEPVRVKEEPVRVKEESVRVKEEPVSDDERSKRSKDKTKNKSVPNDNKNKKSKPQSSKSSGDDEKWGNSSAETKKPEKPKEKPNFATSGKLAEDTNMYNGVVIKYNEPAEARKPKKRWRLYPFKGDTNLPFIPVHRQSAYLFGRTRSIADIPIDHPSCSKQHAVLQFRLVTFKREDGTTGRRVRPYIIDLESSNGTFVNNKKADPRCYVELMEKDVIKFGFSSREYVLLHEESQFDAEDEDVILESD
ncbi:Smad nuclear interacting protein 1 [Araneus ventricosus]|uniref:Smad nuclear interacting protein 1 n=1 Tax=Araneus ventricosus TaxID=182803 RepID=A0A4Y2HSH0_ARAVE|nr:Smad nuclear interacting protein 1 [Araneus ventricosus]